MSPGDGVSIRLQCKTHESSTMKISPTLKLPSVDGFVMRYRVFLTMLSTVALPFLGRK
jgi:hypothetical protein